MAQISYPFETQDTTETQYSALFSKLQTTGVDGDTAGTILKVSANTGMQLNVATGFAIIRGFAYENTAVESLTLATGNTQPRIDLVILRLDPSANSIVLAVKQGTPAASPSAPALTQNAGAVWELPLAQIAVAANTTAIGPSDITDVRRFLGTQVGTWTTTTRPTSATAGTLGYNSTLGAYEFWNGSAWTAVTTAPGVYAGTRIIAAGITTAPSDVGQIILCNNSVGVNVSLANAGMAVGSRIDFIKNGVGQVTFVAAAGNTLASKDAKEKLVDNFSSATAIYIGSNAWRLIGDLSA